MAVGICLADNNYQTYLEIRECYVSLHNTLEDILDIQEMKHISAEDNQWANSLWHVTNDYASNVTHAADLVYIYILIDNPVDKEIVGAYIEEQINFLIKDLEFGITYFNRASYLTENNALSNFCDENKTCLRKVTKLLQSLSFH